MNKDMIKAWFLAVFSVVCLLSFSSVMAGYASKILEVNYIVYTCSVFLGAAFSLLLYAGNGPLGIQTLRSTDTWVYGIVLILAFIVSMALFSYTTATEVMVLQRSGIIASALLGWMFFNRKHTAIQALGLVLVAASIVMIILGSKVDVIAYIIIFTAIFAFLQAIRAFTAEKHKTYSYAQEHKSKKDEIRVVGYIMFIVATLFLVISGFFSFIEFSTGTKVSSIIPDFREFTNPKSIFIGLTLGVIFVAPVRLIEFIAISKIKSENFLAVGALAPFSVLFWEWATSPLTGMSLKEFTSLDLFATVLLTVGGLIMAFSKAKSQISDDMREFTFKTVDDIQAIEDSKDILEKILTYCNGNITRVSKITQIPELVIKIVLSNDDFALKKEILEKVSRIYITRISIKDNLTGLLNRSGLMQALDDLIERNKHFTLFYIDLNKFKPINDQFGHQAGDETLRIIARKLQKFHKNVKLVSRLGGDEFVIVLEKDLDVEKFKQDLSAKIEEYFTLQSVDMVVSISASIGYVCSKDHLDLDVKELLNIADKMMLEFKTESVR